MKILFFLIDGAGDLPCEELNGKTPLEYANTATLDKLASNGKCGTFFPKALGTSVDIASASLMLFSIFGYNVEKFPAKRGIVEAVGKGLDVKEGELWVRCNFSTVDKNWIIKDIRAGRIENTRALEKSLNGMKFVAPFELKATKHYRALLGFKTKMPLSDEITEVDPHEVGEKIMKCRPKNPRDEDATYSAYLVNEFMEQSQDLLSNHPFNKGRVCPANFLLMRGFGSHIPRLQPFKEKYGLRACGLTGLNVNKGILKLCGMDLIEIPESIGGGEKELEVKRAPLEKALKLYNFVFVHIKNADTPGHNGNVMAKVKELELIDKFIGSLDLTDKLVVVTSDHCTPCKLKSHSADPVPFLISPVEGAQKERGFGEHSCTDFKIRPYQLMNLIMKLGKIKR